MRTRKLALMVVAIAAALSAMSPEARGGGVSPGTLTACQTVGPSGAPIRITLSGVEVDAVNNVLKTMTFTANFHGLTYGPFTVTNISIGGAVNQMDAACMIFNNPTPATDGNATTSLADEIIAAFGLRGSFHLTACSLLGPASFDCTAPLGTINTPAGWLGGQITAYVRP